MDPISPEMGPATVVKPSKQIDGLTRRSQLERLPPPASSNKPLTPFSIADILGKPCSRKRSSHPSCASSNQKAHRASPALLASPLCALQELTCKTFKGLELGVFQAAEGEEGTKVHGRKGNPKKRRKSRTAFTHYQIYELEKRFLRQKYLSPADRDQVAQQLALSNSQVITWFQNRRAKLKRDLEEMKADVESARAVALSEPAPLTDLKSRSKSMGPSWPSWPSHLRPEAESAHKLRMSSFLPDHTDQSDSETDDVEIKVDD